MQDPHRGRPRRKTFLAQSSSDGDAKEEVTSAELEEGTRSYIEMERHAELNVSSEGDNLQRAPTEGGTREAQEDSERPRNRRERDTELGRVVDVVLSDMSAPWTQTAGFWKRSVSDPYSRMMNTSGMPFRDHAGSMVRPPKALDSVSHQTSQLIVAALR